MRIVIVSPSMALCGCPIGWTNEDNCLESLFVYCVTAILSAGDCADIDECATELWLLRNEKILEGVIVVDANSIYRNLIVIMFANFLYNVL